MLPGYTEDYISALGALHLPTFADAMDVLAFGQTVQLPLPVRAWDDVSGQCYFDAARRDNALGELEAIGTVEAAAAALASRNPEMLDGLDPPDLALLLNAMKSALSEAVAKPANVAVFRHGGV